MSLTVSHIAARNRHNVGEAMTLRTRVEGVPPQLGPDRLEVSISVSLAVTAGHELGSAPWPRVLTISAAHAPDGFTLKSSNNTHLGLMLIWVADKTVPADSSLLFETDVLISVAFGPELDRFFVKHPELRQHLDREREWLIQSQAQVDNAGMARDETVIAVQVMSRYAQNLPAIYRGWDNDLLGRFLMMSDSLSGRATLVLDHIERYADPLLAPRSLLPWLMSWGGLLPDADWPEPRLRALINTLLWLRRMRGTVAGLRHHIRLYTGYAPRISEPRVSGVQFRTETKLGRSLVLGATAEAHGFEVTAPAYWQTDEERQTHERVIGEVIAFHQPAHAHLRGKLRLEKVTK